jgi:putative transposase
MLLAHRIRIDATAEQRDYFARAAGTARRVWNWALAEWNRQAAGGLRPNAMALKKAFNHIKYSDPDWLDADGKPWLRAIHRDAHAQPFANLAKAWSRYFEQRRAGQPAHAPRFKKKGRSVDGFYLANDKFRIEGRSAVLPKVGRIALREALRWGGKIMGGSVSREAGHWYLAVQVDVPDHLARRRRTGDVVTGVDLGVTSAATLSSGEKIAAPRPLKAALRRLRIRSRRQSRKLEAAKVAAGIVGRIAKGTRLSASKNRTKGALVLARLARAIADVGFYEFRRQLTYKSARYGTQIVLADRWYPSSKLCSQCGSRNGQLALGDRTWACAGCGARHDRDVNAAINLQRLATGALAAHTALPEASQAVTRGTAAGLGPAGGGEVTPVRHEHGQQDGSGQEEYAVHVCTPNR